MDSLKKNITDNNISNDKEINDILKKINKTSNVEDLVEYNNDLNKLKSKKYVVKSNLKNNQMMYNKPAFYSDEELNNMSIDNIRDLNVKVNNIARGKEIDHYNTNNKGKKKIITKGGVTFIGDTGIIQDSDKTLGASAVILGGGVLSQLSMYNIIFVVLIILLLLYVYYSSTCNSIGLDSNLHYDTNYDRNLHCAI